MKKFIIVIAIIIMLAVVLVGCNDNKSQPRFVRIEEYFIGTKYQYEFVFYDRETKVMYMLVKYGHQSGLTPLYNADGTLQLYSEVEE